MEIDLEGQILVLDEAHNIEDCARESASYTLELSSLQTTKDELDGMVHSNIRCSKHESLRNFCYALIKSVFEGNVPFSLSQNLSFIQSFLLLTQLDSREPGAAV